MDGIVEQIFSSSYTLARKRFIDAATRVSADIDSYPHPTARGVDGAQLFADVATIGRADAQHALVLISGTHGEEGYCGSAIQTYIMQSNSLARAANFKVVMVHGLNPYGFSHHRRTNENNIDINRNFVDFADIEQNNSYSDIAPYLHRMPTVWTRASLISLIMTRGFRKLQEAVTRGQYHYPTGLFFGGMEPSWSRLIWTTVLEKNLSKSKHAFFIDYHTGLGKFGSGQILCPADPLTDPGQIARQTASNIFKRNLKYLRSNSADPDNEANKGAVASQPTGDIINYTIEQRRDGSFSGVFFEFGTLGPISVLEALMAENHDFYHPVNDRVTSRVKARLREAFCPDNPRWQQTVLSLSTDWTSVAAKHLIGAAQLLN